MNPIAVALAALAGVALASVGDRGPRSVSPDIARPPKSSGTLREIAETVEDKIGIPGFADFAEAVAWNESRGNPDAINDSRAEASAAARGYDENVRRYGSSGFPRSRYVWGSGGWFGFLPSTALADPAWQNADPLLVLDRVGSVVLLAAFVQRIERNWFRKIPPEHRNWWTIRRFLGSNLRGLDWREEMEGTPGRRLRFARDYRAIDLDPDLMFAPVVRGKRRADPALYREILATQPERTQT